MSNSIVTLAKTAFKDFQQGLATGEWEPFLERLTDDFTFWFPVGSYQGENVGKAKAKEFFNYVSQTAFPQGLSVTINRITNSENTVVFELKSEGELFSHPYINQVAISFDFRGDHICGYREYLGILYQIKPQA
ncbi:MAG TPA: ketosteroid isomerase [Cyanothece sp. UBA12306]|nr:ketosteroid isomerase [Cyanothece sp. UBA12306]